MHYPIRSKLAANLAVKYSQMSTILKIVKNKNNKFLMFFWINLMLNYRGNALRNSSIDHFSNVGEFLKQFNASLSSKSSCQYYFWWCIQNHYDLFFNMHWSDVLCQLKTCIPLNNFKRWCKNYKNLFFVIYISLNDKKSKFNSIYKEVEGLKDD